MQATLGALGQHQRPGKLSRRSGIEKIDLIVTQATEYTGHAKIPGQMLQRLAGIFLHPRRHCLCLPGLARSQEQSTATQKHHQPQAQGQQ
ncbi:hypothetical protein D3C78_1381770 [compost metagenome]